MKRLLIVLLLTGTLPFTALQMAVTAPTSEDTPNSTPEPTHTASPAERPELYMRNLIFYPEGMAPSEDLEFDPIPFESLLPPNSGGDSAQPVDTVEAASKKLEKSS